MPKVSIIVPVYNVEKYLAKCLDSLVNQTLKDIEIICVNDGSTDKSLKILKDFANKDSRIKIIDKKNEGVSVARNSGIEVSTGEYIGFVDSDDWVDTNFYEKLYNSISIHNVDIACATIIRQRKTHSKYRVLYQEEKIYQSLSEKLEAINCPKCSYIWNKLYKTDKVKKIKFKTGIYFEDVYWSLEALKNTDKLITVPNTNYYYRVNSKSIVKQVKNKKRQIDYYNSQKFLVEFYNENNLKLDNKYQNITKSINYIWNIPILKVKENKSIQKYLLFSILPIWIKDENKKNLIDFKFLDNHYFINLFGLTIRIKSKLKHRFQYRQLKEFGLNTSTQRNTQITVSLTSFPERIPTLHYTIESLLTQSLKPDNLILWLANEQFPNKEEDLPKSLLQLKNFGLSIKWCEDIKSYKKLIPTLSEYPDDIIITFDDDIYYDEKTVENLYNAYLNTPNAITTIRAFRVGFNDKKQLSFLRSKDVIWDWKNYQQPSLYNTIIGCGGVLYPPHCLHSDILDKNKFMNIVPTQDDIYFWAMAVLKGTPIQIINGYSKTLDIIENTQNAGLCKINIKKGKGLTGNQSLEKILNAYPEILTILKGGTVCEYSQLSNT